MRQTLTLALILVIAGCAGAMKAPAPSSDGAEEARRTAAAGTPEERIGLAAGRMEDVLTPGAVTEEDSAPGERPTVPRAHPTAPPPVSHGVTDFLPITPRENLCVECHAVSEKIAGEPTPIPPSHYTDLRNAPDEVREEIAGARYVCTSCHMARTDARPLVDNRFGS